MREKSVLVGAGSAMLTRGPAADLLRGGWKCELGLVDVDREAMAMAECLCRKMVAVKLLAAQMQLPRSGKG